jgi:ribosomal protein S27AE
VKIINVQSNRPWWDGKIIGCESCGASIEMESHDENRWLITCPRCHSSIVFTFEECN